MFYYNPKNPYRHSVNSVINSYMNELHFMLYSADEISREEARLCAAVDARKYGTHLFAHFLGRTGGNILDMIDTMSAAKKQAIHLWANEERRRRMY